MANLYGYNTSTARKLDNTDAIYGQSLHKELHNITNTNTNTRKAVKPRSRFSGLITVALCFAMAFAVVSGYVSINEANNEISALRAEYNDIVAGNQALQVKIDKAIDLNQLQEIAGEKFGMVRPERYQMFYVDLEMGDYAENTADKTRIEKEEKINVAGVPGIITGALNIFN